VPDVAVVAIENADYRPTILDPHPVFVIALADG
jgi:hypothetical protein